MIDNNRLEELRDEVGEDDLAEIVGLFCDEVEETLGRIETSKEEALRHELHFIKGSALNVGMVKLGEQCANLERKTPRRRLTEAEFIGLTKLFELSRKLLQTEISER